MENLQIAVRCLDSRETNYYTVTYDGSTSKIESHFNARSAELSFCGRKPKWMRDAEQQITYEWWVAAPDEREDFTFTDITIN